MDAAHGQSRDSIEVNTQPCGAPENIQPPGEAPGVQCSCLECLGKLFDVCFFQRGWAAFPLLLCLIYIMIAHFDCGDLLIFLLDQSQAAVDLPLLLIDIIVGD
jgi:hypothetical protein